MNSSTMRATIKPRATLTANLTDSLPIDGNVSVAGMEVRQHNSLFGREAEDCHPIESIHGLEKELEKKLSSNEVRPMTNMEIENLLK